jgi:hypothetical protein
MHHALGILEKAPKVQQVALQFADSFLEMGNKLHRMKQGRKRSQNARSAGGLQPHGPTALALLGPDYVALCPAGVRPRNPGSYARVT